MISLGYALGAAWCAHVILRDSRITARGVRETLGELRWVPLWPAALFGTVAGWAVRRGL